MGRKKNHKAESHAFEATADKKVKAPHHIPINVYIQEAKNLSHWAQEDKEILTAAGLDPGLIEDLPNRCEALSQAEAVWYVEKNTRKEAAQKWASLSPQAYDLKKRLLMDLSFAFRKRPDLLAILHAIKKKNSQVALLQGLSDLCVMGKKYPGLLSAIGFDMSLLDQAAQTSTDLRKVLAEALLSKGGGGSAKKNRDRAYAHLKETVDEIRVYARFVLRNDKERLKGYASNHLRVQNSKKTLKPKAAAAEVRENPSPVSAGAQ